MRKNIKLFIAGKEVHCSEGISLPMTYTVEDFQNPTIVKNSFSKTISIPGDKNNNKIFGEIYKLDRFLHIKEGNFSGVYFDPSKRVDFGIYNNDYLVESGYMQLNSISIKQAVITYNITLYGGLGDFFYGLKYKEDGTIRTLADLQYFVTDEDGNTLPADTELNFYINKDFVNTCFDWSKTNEGSQIYDYLTFIPAYNGLYEDFDNETCLINTNENSIFPTSKTDSGVTYTPYNGYGLAKLNRAYTEWEMRDLRSYMQRPALKLSKLIETICRKENSGYDVVFDPSFFNWNNPYWSKSFVALPLLSNLVSDEEDVTESGFLVEDSKYNYQVGINKGESTSSPLKLSIASPDIVYDSGIIDLSEAGFRKSLSTTFYFKLKFNRTAGNVGDRYFFGFRRYFSSSAPPFYSAYRGYADVWLTITNEVDDTIYTSEIHRFTNSGTYSHPIANGVNHFGYFQNNVFYDTSSLTNDFVINITNFKIPINKIKIKLNVVWSTGNSVRPTGLLSEVIERGEDYQAIPKGDLIVDLTSPIEITTSTEVLQSNALLTKKLLLKTEQSPADYLLSYAKLFGLYFTKDIDSKTIRIYTRNNFFKNIISDWSKRIDYSKDFNVNPILFDKKWYRMSSEGPETYFYKKYNKEYSILYGQQRLNTGYNFNSETTELYSDNIYENIVSARWRNKYFRNFYNSSSLVVPAFMNDNITYTLFNNSTTELKTIDQELYGANFIDPSKTTEWYKIAGNDIFAKNVFFSIDGNEESLEDISQSLVFFNGNVPLTDVKGNEVTYWITDDLTEMNILNDQEMCYISTKSEKDIRGNKIAIKRTVLPQFTRYTVSSSNVTASWDFGLPQEIYIDDITYNIGSTIYSRFWSEFYNDQFDVNTKKVTCFVRLDDLDVKYDLLRQFYYFEDSYWILNKIDAYDINSDSTVRCEFIKVQDINSYLAGVQNLGEYISFDDSDPVVDYKAGTKKITVTSNIPWELGWYSPNEIVSITPESGQPGETELTVTYNENTTYDQRNFYFSLYKQGSINGPQCMFTQTPDPNKAILITGKLQTSTGGIPSGVNQILTENDNFLNVTYMRDDGSYRIYAQNGVQFLFRVSDGPTGTVKYTENLTLTEDTVKNVTIN